MLATIIAAAIGCWIVVIVLALYGFGESGLREPMHAIVPVLFMMPAIILTLLVRRYIKGARLRKLGVSFSSDTIFAYGCRTEWERVEVLYNNEESPHLILLLGDPKEAGNVWKLSKKDVSSISDFLETAKSKGIRVIRGLP